ncbi:MAG TPA: hypothetical protein VLM79_20070 [Kofleriaceae bacterium]|nr:hypothetical protein [Kofleriaceae bacterium]
MLRTTAVVLALASAGAVAHANPAGFVPVAGTSEQAHVDATYEYEVDTAQITRERVGDRDADPLGAVPLHRDLAFRQARQLVTPRVEVGLVRGSWISFAVPIVLSQSREVSLASGVDRAGSLTIADGILPATGFDAGKPGPIASGDVLFRGVNRTGVPELRGGIGFAPMIQRLDDTKPTWKLGLELRFAIGRAMRFDAVDPGRETGVSTGVHEVRLWTSVDRRTRYFEGWFEAFYQMPIYERAASLFKNPGFGAVGVDPGPIAGAAFGAEANVLDDPATGNRVGIDLGARMTAHFEGRGYSELWEVFAFAGDARTPGPLVLDGDPTMPGASPLNHPGVSNIESYLETAARVAVRTKLGAHLTLSALGELSWRTEHIISFADAGIDLPTCPQGAPRCESTNDELVTPGTEEVNPLFQRTIDLVGHRYHAKQGRGYVLGLEVQLLF